MGILSLCQHLGQMGVVESCIGTLGQLHHLLLCPQARGGCRLPPSVSMSDGICSLPSVRCQHSPRMVLARSHQLRRLDHRHLALHHSVQYLYPRLLSGRQRQSFHGLTLNSYTLT